MMKSSRLQEKSHGWKYINIKDPFISLRKRLCHLLAFYPSHVRGSDCCEIANEDCCHFSHAALPTMTEALMKKLNHHHLHRFQGDKPAAEVSKRLKERERTRSKEQLWGNAQGKAGPELVDQIDINYNTLAGKQVLCTMTYRILVLPAALHAR